MSVFFTGCKIGTEFTGENSLKRIYGVRSNRLAVILLSIEFKLKLLFKGMMNSESYASLKGVCVSKFRPYNTSYVQ